MSAELIHQMYIAYYQRPADPAGLIYWQDQLTANGGGEAGWNAVAAAFANAAESSSLYGNQTLGQKISAIYLAAFERAASAEEVAYWEASGFNAAQIGFAIVNGAQNDDLATVDKKVDYAEAFVAAIDPAGTGVGPFEFQYVDPAQGRQLMDPITKDSDVSAATVASQVSSTLPTLNTVNLTSGNDVVTPQANAAEEINAALGGTAPSLGRADQIDGGSAVDTINVAMDGNFLLGFGSGGFMKDVEVVNLAATASSVTPKQFNFTGVSGVQTINVGAGNAAIGISEISDVGITVNLSGLSTGTFDVGYATGAISGSGSSMTIGVTDVGTSLADAVSLTSDGITELNLVSNGAQNFVNLAGSVNDLVALNVTGSGGLDLTGISNTISGLDASGLGGDFSVEFNVDSNQPLSSTSGTISGGAGHDTVILNGSGIAAFNGPSIEEIKFDGASGEVLVQTTALTSLTTITFSGDAVNTPQVRGLETSTQSGITINATYSAASPDTYSMTAVSALTVNLKADANSITNETQGDNDFTFRTDNGNSVTVNVEEYASSAGTLTVQKASSFDVSIASTADFGNPVKLSAASTINVSGAGAISSTISGEKATTLNLNVGSGTFNFGGSAIQTITLAATDRLEMLDASNISGATTISVDAGGSVELANATFRKATVVDASGGASASLGLGNFDLSTGALSMSVSGFGYGVSANNIEMQSANITLDASESSGKLHITKISGTETVTISTGTLGWFSAGEIHGQDGIVLDMTAKTADSSGDFIANTLSGSGSITLSMGSSSAGQSGLIAISALAAGNNFTLDASSWGGDVDLAGGAAFSVGGATTISLGSSGNLSAENILATKGNFVLDASNAVTAEIAIASRISGGGAVTVSLGTGSTAAYVSAARIDGNSITIDGSNFGGDIDLDTLSSSGSMTFALGSGAEFSAGNVNLAGGNFVLDGSNGQTAEVSLLDISGSGSVTISLGGGSGTVSAGVIGAGKNFTMDAGSSGAKYDFHSISGSGNVTVSLGSTGEFSGSAVAAANGAITIDASAGASVDMTIQTLSANGNLTISMGAGTGDITFVTATTNKNFVFDGSNSSGQATLNSISASGTVTLQLGAIGDLTNSGIYAGGNIAIDASQSKSATISIGTYSGQGSFTLSGGQGSGSIVLGDDVGVTTVGKNFTLDASNYNGDVSIQAVTGSGAATISMGGVGNFSAGNIASASSAVFDFSNMVSAGKVDIVLVSASGAMTTTLGSGSGDYSAGVLAIDGNIVFDSTNHTGDLNFTEISSSGTVTLSVGGDGNISAANINTTGSFTLDNSTSTSGRAVVQQLSASGAITVTLGSTSGGNATTFSAVNSESAIVFSAATYNQDLTFASVSGSKAVTITSGGSGTVSGSAFDALGALTISAYLGGGENMALSDLSASGISLTITGGSGLATISSIQTLGGTFTLDTNASTQKDGAHSIQTVSATAASIVMGLGDNTNISAMAIGSGGTTITTDASSDITVTLVTSVGSLTVSQVGGGEFDFRSAVIGNSLTYNATGLASGGSLQINSASISANVALNYGDGLVAIVSAQVIDTVGSFTLSGGDLTSANVVIQQITSEGAVSIDMGAASGSLALSAINTSSTFTLDVGAAPKLDVSSIETINASAAISITLGAVTEDAKAFAVSSTDTKSSFTLNATAYREQIDMSRVSGDTMTLTFGDLSDSFSAASVITTGTFDLTVGANNANFSADIATGDFGGAFTITMSDISNGLSLGQGAGAAGMSFSASGTIIGSAAGDSASVTSTSQSGDTQTLEFYMGESDGKEDQLNYQEGGGIGVVTIHHFETNVDKILYDGNSSNLTQQTMTTAQAASTIGDALGLGSDPSESDVQIIAGAVAQVGSAAWTYNGDSYYLAGDLAAGTVGTLAAGETVFRFVGITNFGTNSGDMTDF